MSLPHVAVLMAGSSLGGAERSLLSLATQCAGIARFTLILPAGGELERVAVGMGADVRVTPWSNRLLTLGERSGAPGSAALARTAPALHDAAVQLRTLLASLDVDALVTNGVKPHVVGALALRALPHVPLIWYLRESLEGRRIARTALRAVANRCDAAIAISRYVASDAAAYLRTPSDVDVAYNIIGVAFDEGAEPPIDKPASEFWFASIGGLTPLKGHDVFLRAAGRVSRERADARFLIVGANRYAPEQRADYAGSLRGLAEELGVAPVVRFLGHRADVPRLLRQIDVLVQSNTAPEGFGRTVAEAMTAGVPVIASDAWSFQELIADGQTGWLVPPGDVDALAERMLHALDDGSARLAVAERARRFIAAAIEPAACVAVFEATLSRATARRAERMSHA